jgi:hypothetical protein
MQKHQVSPHGTTYTSDMPPSRRLSLNGIPVPILGGTIRYYLMKQGIPKRYTEQERDLSVITGGFMVYQSSWYFLMDQSIPDRYTD